MSAPVMVVCGICGKQADTARCARAFTADRNEIYMHDECAVAVVARYQKKIDGADLVGALVGAVVADFVRNPKPWIDGIAAAWKMAKESK